MKARMGPGSWISLTGVWILPCLLLMDRFLLEGAFSEEAFWGGAVLTVLNFMINLTTYSNGKREFGPFDALFFRTDRYSYLSPLPAKARYPELPDELKHTKPTGVIFGKLRGKYCCVPLNAGGSKSTLCIGGSGCGKTSTVVLDTLLMNPDCGLLCVDIKGELHEKSTRKEDPLVRVIDPMDREACGYDPLYMLGEAYSRQEALEAVNTICFSLIPVNPRSQSPFWEDSARDLLKSCLLYHIRQGKRNLIDCIDEITKKPIEEAVKEVYENSADFETEHRLVSRFVGMAEETLSGINGQMASTLSMFMEDEHVRFLLKDNARRVSPKALDEGLRLFIVIPEYKLDEYARLLHLILNQSFLQMERRKEGSRPVLFVIDELPRILSAGKLSRLSNALEILRSFGCSLLLISQSLEALQRAYDRAEVDAMVQNCAYRLILSASSRETVDDVIRWSGKAVRDKRGRGKSGKSYSSSVSYEKEDLVTPEELVRLPQEGEALLISPYGFNRLKKAPYYKDNVISRVAAGIKSPGPV